MILILLGSLFLSIIGIYNSYRAYEANKLWTEEIERYKVELSVKESYMHGKEADLLRRFKFQTDWKQDVLSSLQAEPLVVKSYEDKADMLDLIVMGNTRSFMTWIDIVHERFPMCRVTVLSAEALSHTVCFHCQVRSVFPALKELSLEDFASKDAVSDDFSLRDKTS